MNRDLGVPIRAICISRNSSDGAGNPSHVTQGQLNGHAWVDLGLPSGILWATCNVGATNPEDYGNYFAWGETAAKTIYDWNTYRYCNGSSSKLTKYCSNSSYGNNGFTDNLTTLEASDDAATVNWGSGWRMPTYDEFYELHNCCVGMNTVQNGIGGVLFTGPNGNSIFLPGAGYYLGESNISRWLSYWTSSVYSDTYNSDGLAFSCGEGDSGLLCRMGYFSEGRSRSYGLSVRPVCNR